MGNSKKVAVSRKQIGGEVPMVVSEVTDGCLYTGFFGTLDSARMQAVTEKILALLSETGIEIVVLDLSNVDVLDSAVASHLTQMGDVVKLVGVEVIFCGITALIAQTMSTAGVSFDKFRVSRDLKSAVKEVFKIQGIELVRKQQ